MTKITATEPYFVRCIKANSQLAAGVFEQEMVRDQLRAAGVLQAVEVARAGFPQRMPLEQFFHEYRHIAPEAREKNGQHQAPDRKGVQALMRILSADFRFDDFEKGWKVG